MELLDLHSTVDMLRASDRILVLGHVQPDGDCLGSMTALALGMKLLGKSVALWADEPVPAKYRFLAAEFATPRPDLLKEFDLVVAVDTSTFARIGADVSLAAAGLPVLAIDHHPVVETRFTYLYADDTQAAVGCMMYDILRELDVPLSPAIADALYAAILTDTGCFTYKNTARRSFEIVLALIDAGVDTADIASTVYNSAPAAQLRLLRAALDTLEFVRAGRGAYMYLSREMQEQEGAAEADTENFVNHVRAVREVEVACMVTAMPDNGRLRISLRSKRPEVDVSALAAQFGGGGHACASGARVDEPLKTFLPKFRARLETFIDELPPL